jgi:hypothetical protein
MKKLSKTTVFKVDEEKRESPVKKQVSKIQSGESS